jgi:hypothetical protein
MLTLMVLFTAVFVAFIAKPMLTAGGLHPTCPKTNLSFSGKRALVVSTSHSTLDPSPIPTGVFLSELTGPYYEFLDAGITVRFFLKQYFLKGLVNFGVTPFPFGYPKGKRV